jgi:glycine/D-amino acid oxidase-like deaminating enzyme
MIMAQEQLSRRVETVIVGGGIAGLACARRLHDEGSSFLLITEDVGGRIRPSADGAVNLGAYYVRSDYNHVEAYVARGRRIKRRDILRGADDGSFTRSDLPLLRHLPQTIRFLSAMRAFRRRYERFKRACLVTSQAEAIRADPLLHDLYYEPAPTFVERHRIGAVSRHYLEPAIRATGFTSLNELTAFTLLVGVLPMVVPIFEHTFDLDALVAGFEDVIAQDSVTSVVPIRGGFSVRTRNGGGLEAANVVVATPSDVATRLLDLGPVKRPISAHMFLVRGNLRGPWSMAPFSVFPPGDEIFAIAGQTVGSTLVSAATSQPDFTRIFSAWEVIEHHHWAPAFHLGGDALLECEQQPGLYLIGDHNVCDLEDAYITGLYAAHRIIAGAA